MMKILIVDDHVLFREGLAAIIRPEADVEIAGLAGTVAEAINMARERQPDIILMDFYLPDGTGVEATRMILNDSPSCKIIFLTVGEEDENLFSAIRSGAKGYLLKNLSPSKLMSSLRSVHQGESALSRSMTLRLMEELARTSPAERPADAPFARLTQREVEVLRELSSGLSNQQISQRMCLSENTVKHHIHAILEKLELPDRRAAADYAQQHGLARKTARTQRG